MKSINLFPVALLGLLCACSGGLENDDRQPGELRAVSVTQVSVVGELPASRAIIGDNTYQLGVIRAATPPYAAVWNHPYSYTASGWTSSVPIAVDHRPATFYAYYPYHTHTAMDDYSGLAGGYTFGLRAQAYRAVEDICISEAAVTVAADGDAAPTLSFLDMPHVYSRIQLTLMRGYGTIGAYEISNINFMNGATSFASRATQYIQTKAVVLTQKPAGWDYNPNISIEWGNSEVEVIDLLVPPQPIDGGLVMTFTIDGQRRSVTIPAGQFTSNTLAAGVQYQIALALLDAAITMDGTVQREEWTEASLPYAGGPPMTNEPNWDYVPWIAIPSIGLKVAKGNLMRNDGTGRWYLARDQGYYSYNAYGEDYFNYGDGNSHSIGYGYNQNANEITAGCVAVLGPGWHVPTKAENQKLVQSGSVWGTYNSQRGKSNGRYFGTIIVPHASIQDEYVFLPAAGFRYDGGSMDNDGSTGSYWSSEPYGSGNAYYLTFSSSHVNGASDAGRAFGQSVRCVAKL